MGLRKRLLAFLIVLVSLFSKVMMPPRLFSIWIAALASGDPMDFFQHMMAMAMILIYPEIVDSEQVVCNIEISLNLLYYIIIG